MQSNKLITIKVLCKKTKKIISSWTIWLTSGRDEISLLRGTVKDVVAVESGITAVLLLLPLPPAVFRFFVFVSHAALCQLWLCNMDVHIIDFSFWLMLLQLLRSWFAHLFLFRGASKLYIILFLALYHVAAVFWNRMCFVILSPVVVEKLKLQ